MKRWKVLAVILCAILVSFISCPVFAKMPVEVAKKKKDRPIEEAVKLEDITQKIGIKEITATPSMVQTGQMVTLSWKILPKNPGDVISGKIEIHYEGFYSGKFTGLPKVGQMAVCPLGNTIYYLTLVQATKEARLAEVNVKAPCPITTLTEENMHEIAQSTKPNIAALDPSVVVKDIDLKINPSGISITVKAKKKVKPFPDTDVMMYILAYPKIEGNQVKVDIRKCDVLPIFPKRRRIIIDVFTLGIFEGALKGFNEYCETKYSLMVKEILEKRFNTFVTLSTKPDDITIIRLSQGKMDFISCKKCR